MVSKTTISQQQQYQKRHQEDITDKDDDQEANSSASLATRESFSNDDGASENGASLKTKKLVNRQRYSLFYGHNDMSDSESVSVAASKPPPQSLDYYDDVKKNLNFDDDDEDENEDTDDEDIENNGSRVPNGKKTVNFVIDLRSQTSKISNKPTTNPNKQQSASKSTTPQQDHNLSTSSRATSMISLSTVTSASSMSLLRPNTSRITTKPNSTAGRKKWK